MITEVAATPQPVLEANGDAQDATVLVMFARSTQRGDAMGVAITRMEALNLIMQLQAHLDDTEHDEHVHQAPTVEQAADWGQEPGQ